ncbi:MAG: hypothetical protein KGJ60_08635 [Verrucomicrobiota bacterium]|nr:hypothetical protein [Verrucomicrobiota bacterium]
MATCLAGGLVLAAAAPAANPYATIAERNVFGLNPPKPQEENKPPVAPPPKITVNGITGVFGDWQALFKAAVPAQPGKPARENSYMLGEGQRQDDIEVTRIDSKAGIITFNNHGVVQEIPLADPTKTTVPVPRTASIPMPGRNFPRPVGLPMAGGLPPGIAARFTPGAAPAINPQTGLPMSSRATPTQPQQKQQLSPEEQMILIAAQHAKAQAEGNPIANIFPPTPLDKDAGIVDKPVPPVPGGGTSR